MLDKLLNLLWNWLCAARVAELEADFNAKLSAIEGVFEEQLRLTEEIREECKKRIQVLDNELSATESRLVTRLEPLEDALSGEGVIQDGEEDAKTGEFVKWSVRKARVAEQHTDPSVFTDPTKYKYHQKPAEPVAQEK